MDALERKVQRRLAELGRRLDERLDSVAAAQTLLADGCFDDGVCRGLEQRLSAVLEKIFDVYAGKIDTFSNSTIDLDSLVVELMEMVKSQHTQLIRTVSHNTNMVVRLTKDAGLANKELINSVDMLDNKTNSNLQEIQDQIKRITFTNLCNKTENMEDVIFEEVTTPQTIIHNVTEVTFVAINTTTLVNTTSNHNESDVLRITTEEDGVMADNSSVIQRADQLKSPVKPSVLQIIGMLSPNMTQDKAQSLLYYLNSTVNFENLQAIIQNTEADSLDKEELYSDDTYDAEGLNSTTPKSGLNLHLNNRTTSQQENSNETVSGMASSQLTTNNAHNNVSNSTEVIGNIRTTETNLQPKEGDSSEADVLYEEVDEETMRNELSDIDSTTTSNNPLAVVAVKMNETVAQTVPEELKDQIKVLALLIKIKNSNTSLDDSWSSGYGGEHNSMNTLLPTLQNLCLADKNVADTRVKDLSNILENRLQNIRQTINDEIWYEKVQSICSRFVDFYHYNITMTDIN